MTYSAPAGGVTHRDAAPLSRTILGGELCAKHNKAITRSPADTLRSPSPRCTPWPTFVWRSERQADPKPVNQKPCASFKYYLPVDLIAAITRIWTNKMFLIVAMKLLKRLKSRSSISCKRYRYDDLSENRAQLH